MNFLSIDELKTKFLSECTACGYCDRLCQASRISKATLSKDVYDFLESSQFSKKVAKWNTSCSFCGRCNMICPRGVNREQLKTFLKIELARNNYPRSNNFSYLPFPSFLNVNFSGLFPFLRDYIKNLNPKRSKYIKRRRFKKIGQKDVVLYTGCGVNALPDSINALFDVFSALNIDYGVLDGPHNNACCGRVDLELGNWNSAEKLGKKLIKELNKFNPTTVLVFCTSCYYMFKNALPFYAPFDFEVKHCTEYIGELKSELQAATRMEEKLTVAPFDSCHMRETKQFDGIRNCLTHAGYKVREMKHSKSKSLCCVSGVLNNGVSNLFSLSNHPVLKEAKAIKGLDTVTELCAGCHLVLSLFRHVGVGPFNYKFSVENWPVTMAKSLGINYPNYLTSILHPTYLWNNLKIVRKSISNTGGFKSFLRNII